VQLVASYYTDISRYITIHGQQNIKKNKYFALVTEFGLILIPVNV